MGLRIRKSFCFGPVRINISKSGIGYSCGIGGLRWTVLPDGRVRTTATIPGTGISWVEESSGRRKKNKEEKISHRELEKRTNSIQINGTPGRKLMDSCVKDNFISTTETEILSKIKSCKTRRIILFSAIYLSAFLGFLHPSFFLITLTLFFGYVFFKNYFSIYLEYTLKSEVQEYWEKLSLFWQTISTSEKKSVTEQLFDVEDGKRFAGASLGSTNKQNLVIKPKLPPYINSNIIPYTIHYGNKSLYFFPDFVLVDTGYGLFSASFGDFQFMFIDAPCACVSKIPSDSKKIGTTWRYVNKSGGPDRRFSGNYAIPIMQFGGIYIKCINNFSLYISHSNKQNNDEAEKIFSNLRELIKNLKIFDKHKKILIDLRRDEVPFKNAFIPDIICKNCGHSNNPGNNYCVKCGSFLNRKKANWED